MTKITPNRRHQILALSGGGYRGLFGAEFLNACEQEYGTKCVERFDLIVGTSIGALLAAGLAAGISAKRLCEVMKLHGPTIFKRNVLTSVKQHVVAAPYSATPIEYAIRETLGDTLSSTPLSAFNPALAITTVNYSTGQTEVLRSKGLAGKSASDVPIEDAILASAAAPTFFPTKKIGSAEYIDGGLVANAPDMVALLDATGMQHARLEQIYHLSIGTAGRRQGSAVHETSRGPGSLSWVARRGLIQTIMAAQEHLALSQSHALLGDRFLRIDEEPAQQQVAAIKALDRATKESTDTLCLLAETAWKKAGKSRPVRDFFVR